MRVIKFRGKVNGNWWYVTPEDEAWEQFWSLVDKSTVGQFTERLDKSGKEIYESDIAKWFSGDKIGIVKFGDYNVIYNDTDYGTQAEEAYGYFVQWIKSTPQVELDYQVFGEQTFVDNTETLSDLILVIGNIHENPELVD